MKKQINVAIVGLGFGASFAGIYQDHPNVGKVGVYDPEKKIVKKVVHKFGIEKVYDSFEDILNDDTVDAVHLISPIPLHEEQTVKVLEAGKHCSSTVPMATSLEGIQKITNAVNKSGKNYMMMETTLYTYQFFYIQELLKNGTFGRIQFMRGSHYQNMENWPNYWMGLPPFWYGTHAVSPLRVLADSPIKRVHGFGSGTMEDSLIKQYGNPYPVECAVFEFENGLKSEATRTLFETARCYQEGLFVYGSDASFEWGFKDSEDPYLELANPNQGTKRGVEPTVERVKMPNYHQRLPEEIQKYTVGKDFDPTKPQDSLKTGEGGAHHGSHPHLVHEFVSSILEDRKPAIDVEIASNIMAACVLAHDSAMNGGKAMDVLSF